MAASSLTSARRLVLLCLGFAFWFCTGASFAQGLGSDQGYYQILQARYGTATRNVDVTGRLKALVREDQLLRMDNALFGVDPAPGQLKMLRIDVRSQDGRTRTLEYTEGALINGAQFTAGGRGPWRESARTSPWGEVARPDGDHYDAGALQILQASYGSGHRYVDVSARLMALARRDRTLRIDNATMGVDPTPGLAKTLRLRVQTENGQVQMLEYREGQHIDGHRFTASAIGAPRHWDADTTGNTEGLVIQHAWYGHGAQRLDVTARLRALERAGRIDQFINANTMGADPAPGQRKTLWLSYFWAGQPYQIQVLEDQRLRIP